MHPITGASAWAGVDGKVSWIRLMAFAMECAWIGTMVAQRMAVLDDLGGRALVMRTVFSRAAANTR